MCVVPVTQSRFSQLWPCCWTESRYQLLAPPFCLPCWSSRPVISGQPVHRVSRGLQPAAAAAARALPESDGWHTDEMITETNLVAPRQRAGKGERRKVGASAVEVYKLAMNKRLLYIISPLSTRAPPPPSLHKSYQSQCARPKLHVLGLPKRRIHNSVLCRRRSRIHHNLRPCVRH